MKTVSQTAESSSLNAASVADWRPGATRLRNAIGRFTAHQGPLAPHFAYGALPTADYALAHTFHIANHQDEIVLP